MRSLSVLLALSSILSVSMVRASGPRPAAPVDIPGGVSVSPPVAVATDPTVAAIRSAAIPLGTREADAAILERVGDAHWVLIGEASHGTHEFYQQRAEITKRLITEKGFDAVVVEADWPDAYRVNRYVRGAGDDPSADAALGGFTGFPTWMWRNRDVADFAEWLRGHNASRPPDEMTGFYGMDLYSLYESMEAVVATLERIDPAAASRARERYGCFEDFADDPQRYGAAAATDDEASCRDQVREQLRESQRLADAAERRGGPLAGDEAFAAEQNARVAANAEEYYRALYDGRRSTWNMRDTHMADTLDALADHLREQAGDGSAPRIVVWAHNSHLGDARATSMGEQGELNVGQLVRERHSGDAVAIGFTTWSGAVMAARNWGDAPEVRSVTPALRDSYEALLHDAATAGPQAFVLDLDGPANEPLATARLQRAIGVIYRPETERLSHYFEARLPEQFDLLIHFDTTSAVEPLPAPAAE
jgi:erythromycin esterase-like protein